MVDDELSAGRRERDFWGHQIPSLDEALAVYESGPEPNTRAMFDALEPLNGTTVLDFACGVGVTTAWLAARGADVTGIDITPEAIEQAKQLCDALGLTANLECCDLSSDRGRQLPVYERVTGKFALHHVDISVYGPLLAAHLEPTGVGAFLETMYSNPLLYATRKFLPGHLGVARLGTVDEKPIARRELRQIAEAFGELRLQLGQMICFIILDRQVFRFRRPRVTRICSEIDRLLYRSKRLHWLSYQRLIVVRRRT